MIKISGIQGHLEDFLQNDKVAIQDKFLTAQTSAIKSGPVGYLI